MNLLLGTNNFPLYALVIVRSPTGGTQAIHIVLDVVVAELTDLYG